MAESEKKPDTPPQLQVAPENLTIPYGLAQQLIEYVLDRSTPVGTPREAAELATRLSGLKPAKE